MEKEVITSIGYVDEMNLYVAVNSLEELERIISAGSKVLEVIILQSVDKGEGNERVLTTLTAPLNHLSLSSE